jgi:predicted protein tyrosine phosphatase
VSFDRITEFVHIGSRIASVEDYHKLRAYGIRACVDMKDEGADPWTFEAFLWLPTIDHRAPSQQSLRLGIAFLAECERLALPVLVHCLAGVGRSTTLVLAYLLASSHRGQPARDVLDTIRLKRPVANPNAAQLAAAEEAARLAAG